MGDANWVDTWPSTGDPACPGNYDTSTGFLLSNPGAGINGPGTGRLCIDRHAGGINMAFEDGHVKYLQLSKLPGTGAIRYLP